MSIGPRLELRQSQQLVMTPQLQQAIKLLQMTNLELSEFIDAELERNPLLARAGEEGEARRERGDETPTSIDGAIGAGDLSQAETPFDTGVENLYEANAAPPPAAAGGGGHGRPEGRFEDALAATPSLLDHLGRQIAMMRADRLDRAVALAIAADLDEDGYFRGDVAETAARLGVGIDAVARGLALVQACEPAGIGARSLAECLVLQLRERGRYDTAMRALLENLELLGRAEMTRLRRICDVGEEAFAGMLAEIRRLDPRPARGFAGGAAGVTIAPDVFVRRGNLGDWVVELNTETLPRVLVDNAYVARIRRGGDGEARRFISECQQNAGWLVRSLEQRARTILRVSEEIVRQQHGFFAEGVSGLKPMTLKSVAEAISMHESTVSRVTAGKFIATERGTFELKYFFTAAIGATDGGEAHSSEAVRGRISGLIGQENPLKPLSDEKIANLLEKSGVDIARRTVAKYRESMNIPSSSQRKRMNMVSISG